MVSFRSLGKEDYQILFERELAGLAERLTQDHAVQLEIASEAHAALLEVYSAQTEGHVFFCAFSGSCLPLPWYNMPVSLRQAQP